MDTMEHVKIGLVDDDELVLKLISQYLKSQNNFDVLFSVKSGKECIEQLATDNHKPDILILDLNMEGIDGIELTEIVKKNYPDIKIIVVSSHYKTSFMGFMLKTGVSSFLPKGISPEELVMVINEVYKKGYFFKDEQLQAIRSQLSSKSPKPILNKQKLLTQREKEILILICKQKTAKEIGTELYITPRTVEGHKNNLYMKCGAKNIAGLVIFAIQNEIIKLEDLPQF